MNNDLISREALKKSFEETVCIEPMPYAFVKQIIDNAPTVEPNIKLFKEWKCADCEEREKSFYDGWQMAKSRFEKPQGEWIWSNNHWGLGDWLCNKCEHYAHDKSNFCPNCGADMRGENNGNKNS